MIKAGFVGFFVMAIRYSTMGPRLRQEKWALKTPNHDLPPKTGYTPLTMIQDISITVLPGEEGNESIIRRKAAEALSKNGAPVKPEAISALVFRKKSVDARHGRVLINLRFTVYVGELPPTEPAAGEGFTPAWKKADPARRVVIVGSGPAGLFAALKLLESGITPIVVERGKPTSERKRDIANITRDQRIDSDSNYCFGEGGAGTFSDGKLYTRSNKRGDIGRILAIFHHHGADAEILTDAHPHIGSDRLPEIINRMRETIEAHGGSFRFGLRCAGLVIEGGRVTGIEACPSASGDEGASTGAEAQAERIMGDAVILATGHSARDVYAMLARLESTSGMTGERAILEGKTFAMGVRVEHPRELIDRIQYHGQERGDDLPAATYRLVAQADGRGVYSFCMCPGGLIVPSATADDEIVLNGMSPSGRNTRWSNAAIVVETRVEDIPERFRAPKATDEEASLSLPPTSTLSGLRYQMWLEREAKRHGKGQKAPAQRVRDFVDGRESETLPECSYSPGVVPSRLDQWLPEPIADRLREGFLEFNKNMRGFISDDAILVAPETRTSSPVRILRDGETLESAALRGLYPAGEGSGYAGGIVSSAMDGERIADAIAQALA